MKRKDSGKFDHTNVMGIAFSWILVTFILAAALVVAVMLVGWWGALVFPIGQLYFVLATHAHLNEDVGDW